MSTGGFSNVHKSDKAWLVNPFDIWDRAGVDPFVKSGTVHRDPTQNNGDVIYR